MKQVRRRTCGMSLLDTDSYVKTDKRQVVVGVPSDPGTFAVPDSSAQQCSQEHVG